MRHANTRVSLAAALSLAFAAGGATSALAQQDFDDSSLQSFAVAALQVQEINAASQAELQAAEDSEAQQQVQAAATEQMVQAIESEGLTVDEYNEIANAAQADPELSNQIQQYITEAQ